jgi:hypothetical protein
MELQLRICSALLLSGCDWPASWPGHFSPKERTPPPPAPIEHNVRWSPYSFLSFQKTKSLSSLPQFGCPVRSLFIAPNIHLVHHSTFIHLFIHSIIQYSVLRQVHSPFQSELSTEGDLMLLPPISSIPSFH